MQAFGSSWLGTAGRGKADSFAADQLPNLCGFIPGQLKIKDDEVIPDMLGGEDVPSLDVPAVFF